MDPRFAQALMLANNPTALGGSPLGGGSDIVNLQNLAQLQFKGAGAEAATGAAGGAARAKAAEEEAAAEAARQQSVAAVKKKIADNEALADDPKNYSAEINDKGGYTFRDPAGKEIVAAQYAKATNQRLTDVFKDSQDPEQRDFTKTYKQVSDYGKALAEGDKKAAEKLFKDDPKFGEYARGKTFKQVVDGFHQLYGGYLRPQQTDAIKQDAEKAGSLNAVGLAGGQEPKGMISGFIDNITGKAKPQQKALLSQDDVSKDYKKILEEEDRKRKEQKFGSGFGGFLNSIFS